MLYQDPDTVGVSLGADDLADVTVLTKEGATYLCPDVSRGVLNEVLPESGRIVSSQPSLALVNASGAVLIIPFRIIKTVSIGEKTLWDCPA